MENFSCSLDDAQPAGWGYVGNAGGGGAKKFEGGGGYVGEGLGRQNAGSVAKYNIRGGGGGGVCRRGLKEDKMRRGECCKKK